MFFRSCTSTCFLIIADVNVNKFVFPLSSTHFWNDFLSNSYENITFSIQNTHAHINVILISQLIQTLDRTSTFIYPISAEDPYGYQIAIPVSAIRSIWILLFSKNNYVISIYSNRMELYKKKVYPYLSNKKKPHGQSLHNYLVIVL